jgi:hypothetical protein
MKNLFIASVTLFLCNGLWAQAAAEIGSQFTEKKIGISLFFRAPIKKGPVEILLHSFFEKEGEGNMLGVGSEYKHFHFGVLEGFSEGEAQKTSLVSGIYAAFESEKLLCDILVKYPIAGKFNFESAMMARVKEKKKLSFYVGAQLRGENVGPRVDVKSRGLGLEISPFTWNFDSKESGFFLGASWELQKKEK